MRYTLKDSEIKEVVDLLINKYELSTNFLNKLYGIEEKEIAGDILEKFDYMILDKYYLCRLIVLREGINLLSNRELRKKILDKLDDETIIKLYEKYPANNSRITTASYMRKPLSEKKWVSGKRWAQDFVKYSGVPEILAGIGAKREEIKRSVQIIEPKRKVPELVDYQIKIKDKILNT